MFILVLIPSKESANLTSLKRKLYESNQLAQTNAPHTRHGNRLQVKVPFIAGIILKIFLDRGLSWTCGSSHSNHECELTSDIYKRQWHDPPSLASYKELHEVDTAYYKDYTCDCEISPSDCLQQLVARIVGDLATIDIFY